MMRMDIYASAFIVIKVMKKEGEKDNRNGRNEKQGKTYLVL